MKGIKLYIAISLILLMRISLHASEIAAAEVAIFPVFTGEMRHDEILKISEYMAGEAFTATGRFYPLPRLKAGEIVKKSDGKDRLDLYRRGASSVEAELICVLELTSEGRDLKLSVRIEALDERFSSLNSEKVISSRIPANLAAKAARHIALLMKGEKLICSLAVTETGMLKVNGGEWHGLAQGRYRTSAGDVEISSVERFSSTITGLTGVSGGIIEFDIYPDPGIFLSRLSREIDENTVRFYGTDPQLNKRRGSARESIIGTCVINQGASFCLPGYGSFLSLEYMGIEKGEPDMYGIFATGALTALHLTLPSMMNSFEINFLPWVMDKDKGIEDRRLQVYLWATLPLTFSVSFYNQLAYQYHRKSLLPPLFEDHDAVAAVVSLFIPGGGMFYKGHRLEGWCFYLTEISLGGYAVYEWDRASGKAAAGGLLLVKAAEVLASYAVKPSYRIYRDEIASDRKFPDIDLGFRSGYDGSGEIFLSFTGSF